VKPTAHAARALSALAGLLLAALLLPSLAHGVQFELTERSPDAAYAVWVTTSLDLSAPGQPVTRVELRPDADVVEVAVPSGQPHWVFLHERFQPRGGPPLDLLLPASLLPNTAASIRMASVDPTVLMTRERFSMSASAWKRTLFLILLVLGGGLGLRRALSDSSAREGRRCAPLAGAELAPASLRHRRVFWALIAVLVALRVPGFFTESLDLLEVSYLPGIGRPAPFADGSTGFASIAGMLRELAALYALDLTHPPLYHAVLGVFGLVGSAGWLLRIPALLASLGSAWFLWQLGRRGSEEAGLAAVGLFAFAAPAVYFAQDATPYAFVGTVALGATWCLLRALESGARRHWDGFFGLLVAGVLCHYNVAPFGIAMVLMVLVWVLRAGPHREWRAALHLGLGEALLLAPLPLAWAHLHFSTFPTVAQDTRLVADTYMADPGWLSYLVDFTKVTAGIRADGPTWALLGVLPLLALGLHSLWSGPASPAQTQRRLLLQTLAVLAITFVVSTLFFYENARTHLGGRIFYGFRWVGWYHPVLLGTVALGLMRGAGPMPLRAALAVLWLAGALPSTVQHLTEPNRPDYQSAADLILDELEDGDGLATLPAWFQRGNLAYYLFNSGRVNRLPNEGEGAWDVDGKRLTLEAVHAGLPFETTARNSHVDRLWVAVVRETMFGRDKFDAAVAAQAIAWADKHLAFEQEWQLDRLVIRRYSRRPGDLAPSSAPLRLDAGQVPLMARTYPPVQGPLAFERPASIPPLLALGPTLSYQAPMTPACVDYEFDGLPDGLRPEAALHWYLDLRVPGDEPTLTAVGSSNVQRSDAPSGRRYVAVGPPCERDPLRFDLSQ